MSWWRTPRAPRVHEGLWSPLSAHTTLGPGQDDPRVGLDEGELVAIRTDKLVEMRGRPRRIGDGVRDDTRGRDRIVPAIGDLPTHPIETLRQLALHMPLPIIGFPPRQSDRELLVVPEQEALRRKNIGAVQGRKVTEGASPDRRRQSAPTEQTAHRQEESEAEGLHRHRDHGSSLRCHRFGVPLPVPAMPQHGWRHRAASLAARHKTRTRLYDEDEARIHLFWNGLYPLCFTMETSQLAERVQAGNTYPYLSRKRGFSGKSTIVVLRAHFPERVPFRESIARLQHTGK